MEVGKSVYNKVHLFILCMENSVLLFFFFFWNVRFIIDLFPFFKVLVLEH
jgi:hypothetical protein